MKVLRFFGFNVTLQREIAQEKPTNHGHWQLWWWQERCGRQRYKWRTI